MNEKIIEIRQLLRNNYFRDDKEAEKSKKALATAFPKTMFSFRFDWEGRLPELKHEMILEIIKN